MIKKYVVLCFLALILTGCMNEEDSIYNCTEEDLMKPASQRNCGQNQEKEIKCKTGEFDEGDYCCTFSSATPNMDGSCPNGYNDAPPIAPYANKSGCWHRGICRSK